MRPPSFGPIPRAAIGVWRPIESPNQVPGSSDSAFITNNGTYTLTMENLTVGNVTLGGGSGQQILDWNGGSLAAGSA